jgi:predicted 3-demethylubiquinone-9 3-methyltransferase (glyoxalase superfamily)
MPAITTSLMFNGQAEEAMTLYTSLFKNSKVIAVHRWLEGEPGDEGKITHAVFSLDGQVIRCMDSGVPQDFSFTPATSLFVSCTSEAQIDDLYANLSKDRKTFMPLEN